MQLRIRILTVALACTVFSGIAADIYMRQEHSTYAVEGQEPSVDTVVIWAADNALISRGSDQTVLVRLDKETVYLIDEQKKHYSEMPFSVFEEASNQAESEMDNEQIPEQFRDMMTMKVSVTPTDETKKIDGYSCRKYVQKITNPMMKMSADLWATKEIDIDPKLFQRYYSAFSGGNSRMQEFLGQLYREFAKIEGVVVYSESVSEAMGRTMKSSTKLLEAKKKEAPAGTFEVPKKYKKAK